MKPHKLTIEITGEKYSYVLTDEAGNVLWRSVSKMESAGYSVPEGNDPDIYESELFDKYKGLANEIDALTFGPFGVAGALRNIADFD